MATEVISAKLSQLESFGRKVVGDFTALTARVQSLERAGGQPNIIEKILVNGIQLAVDGNKAVHISVPTKASQLENDAGFQNGEDVDAKLDGKADSGHNHDSRYFTKEQVNSAIAGKADTSHTHDDRYYTESEMNTKLNAKANTSHTHDDRYYTEAEVDEKVSAAAKPAWDSIANKPTAFTPTSHNHDDRYYTESEVDSKLSAKAASSHTHDDRYYTEAEVDAKLTGVAASGHNHDDRYYTETEMDTKLAGKLHEETVTANIDADTIKTTGVYHLKGSTSNVPESGHCTLWVDATVGTVYQIFMHDSAYTAYKRVYTGGAWSGWTQLKFSDTTYGAATQSAAGLMSAADKKKLDNVAAGANAYSLPTATASVLGGVKTGSNITNSGGTISITKANVTTALGYTPPTSNTWRGVQDNLTSTATDQSLSANQGKVLKGLVDGKAASSHTHDDRYYTETEMNTKLNGKANSSHTHNYAGSSSAGGTANSVNGLTFAAQTTDPGAGSSLTTNKVLIVYV